MKICETLSRFLKMRIWVLRVDLDSNFETNHIYELVGSWVDGIYHWTRILTRRAPGWLFLTFWEKCKDQSFIYCNCFILHLLMILTRFWLDLSRAEVYCKGKASLECWLRALEVSILPNVVWEKLPRKDWFVCTIWTTWKTCTRDEECVHGLHVKIWPI